jgi:AraC-like DNA-binding protein
MKTLLDLMFILNGTLGLICFALVVMNIKKNRAVNIYLAILLFLVSIRFILRGFLELTHDKELFSTLSHYDVFLIAIPLPYLYFRNLSFKKSNFKNTYLLHFILPIFIVIENNFQSLEYVFNIELTALMKLLIISTAVYYIVISFILLSKSFWRKTTVIEFKTEQEKLLKKWTIVFYFTFVTSAINLIWNQLFIYGNDFLSENFMTWITWLALFIMILSSPTILNEYITQLTREPEKEKKQFNFWRAKPIDKITNQKDFHLSQKINGELDEYFVQITQFVQAEHFFRKSDMTINDLALKSKIPVSHLSFIFKYYSDVSFSDFKKVIRIHDAVALIDEGYLKTNTLDSLAKKVGFNNYNSFFSAFKEITGHAPQKYVINLSS